MNTPKIIATIGPSSDRKDTMLEMAKAGMSVARINFSHETHEIHINRIRKIREMNKEHGLNVKILIDLKGPEVRLSGIKSPIQIKKGQRIFFGCKKSKDCIKLSNNSIIKKLKENSRILIDDGYAEFLVVKNGGEFVECEALNECILKPRKNFASEFILLDEKAITDDDCEIIDIAIKEQADFLALSHIKRREDVLEARSLLKGHDISIISKIENHIAIDNISEIIDASDGIMVARGDLGLNVPNVYVPLLQEYLVKLCKKQGKFGIVATQMMESMIENRRPTRSDVNDIYTAVVQGANAVMLSGETAAGKYPVEVVNYMKRIIDVTKLRKEITPQEIHKIEIHKDLA